MFQWRYQRYPLSRWARQKRRNRIVWLARFDTKGCLKVWCLFPTLVKKRTREENRRKNKNKNSNRSEKSRTSVNNLPSTQVRQSLQHPLRNLPKHFFSSSTFQFLYLPVDAVQAPTLTKLHYNWDGCRGKVHECAVIFTDIWRWALLVETKFAEDLFLDFRVRVCSNNLNVLIHVSRTV